ncbi:MAG: Na+/H+ antiporter NhaC family protein [Clostridia bacterium]|nr:Na+/H+ antiporter NhaC family protein [Clostridia bacterium]
MLNNKKLTGKAIALIVAVVVILALLIVAVATGGVHNTVDCPDCKDGTCITCSGTMEVDCKDCIGAECTECEGLGKVACGNCEDGSCPTCGGEGVVTGSFWALLPPIIAIGLALITKEVFSSLFVGLLSGAILASDFSFVKTMDSLIGTGLTDAVSGTAGIFIFLIELGILVSLVNKAGGSRAFGEWAETHVKTKIGAALCTFVLGILIFIDDYFNCLTVGSVMRPVTDKHKISRSKLAFLIDATAAPICMIAPISSWAAAVAQYAKDGQGLNLFIAAIPMNFYSILTLVFVLCLILMKFDFGPMRKHEINAQNGDLFSGKKISDAQTSNPNPRGKVMDLVIPIVILLLTSVFALVYVGGILSGKDFVSAFGNTDATIALPWGGIITLVLTIAYMCIRKVVTFKEAMDSIPQGFIAMVPAILILTFATALKNMTGTLGAKFFVGNMMNSFPETLAKLLPAVIFIVACILAFATGTSWGTFGILIPIVTAMFDATDPLFVLGISACLAGAVCGDHCSPISDTTIMSSAGAECEHLNHVSTQLPYSIFVAIISFVCFIVAGFIPVWYVMLPLSVALMIGAMFALKYITKKYYAKLEVNNDGNKTTAE